VVFETAAVRYIGNKTKLLSFLNDGLRKLAIPPGVAHDAFAGTAAVGRSLKANGWRVHSSDLMRYSYVMQRAYVVASAVERFDALADVVPSIGRATAAMERLAAVAGYLSHGVPPRDGFFARNFGPAGGRMYFTDENARRIDAARTVLHEWHANGLVSDDAFYLLLAGIIEGADRVANTAGVYAAYIKHWQPNAIRSFTVTLEQPIPSAADCAAHHGDAIQVAGDLGELDLLYVDPPYNTRQYAGYYHVPELIARGWFDDEVALRGKTGLIADGHQRSAWCSKRTAADALRGLLVATGARHVLVSYNSEGVISDRELRGVLDDFSIDGTSKRFMKRYKRYRADRDHAQRRYKADQVHELLYYARLR
jgi:adenine-specific DNA-methyltransferase